ncbi:VCBS repeat-containing protein [Polaribacter sp. Z022]|uniref:FG-GAP repeat domain-containing protein n=1 Tax=Polaribacter sp. Z022 TaxID=2927125 RepID=UPI002021D6AE|nr:VCBS repeat-containing protein [Polaribacter sp. Z022]MCL7754333.1 VCBS repeat-containing protein [Polaribacter sp. Z022]
MFYDQFIVKGINKGVNRKALNRVGNILKFYYCYEKQANKQTSKQANKLVKFLTFLLITFLFYNCESEVVDENEFLAPGSFVNELTQNEDDFGGGGSGGNVGYTSTTGIWTTDYVYNSGWRVNKHPRIVADVNGDGKGDIVAFDNNNVKVSLSNGSNFLSDQVWYSGNYCENHNYRTYLNPRTVADVNGDGKEDLVIFGDDNVFVSLSDGTKFLPGQTWCNGYGVGSYLIQNWRVDKNPRVMADVNGDNKADIIGFGNNAVYVSLSTGSSFQNGTIWNTGFVQNQNWKVDKHPRTVADVNGDGKADIVAFGSNDVWVSLSNGSSFNQDQIWKSSEYVENQNWKVYKNPRMLSDVNGDGKADIVAYGDYDVWVALSNGNGFGNGQVWYNGYGYGGGFFGAITARKWEVNKNPRLAEDVDGDGKGDIIGFGDNDVWVTTSKF